MNRYKITGSLTLLSPLHIGDGEMDIDENRLPKPKNGDKSIKFSKVMLDFTGRAYIPGSTLKGVLRSWLSQIFTWLDLSKINTIYREDDLKKIWEDLVKKDQQMNIHNSLKLSEYLFGTGINEGKLEFEDAFMAFPPKKSHVPSSLFAGYDSLRGTMILKGVAIDPETGTASDKKLFNYEAVPSGTIFNLTVNGQNLHEVELGMLLFALEGFNSQIYPITLGAMSGIGFGRSSFKRNSIYCLDQKNIKAWLDSAIETGHAGYEGLDKLDEKTCQERVDDFKKAFKKKLELGGEK